MHYALMYSRMSDQITAISRVDDDNDPSYMQGTPLSYHLQDQVHYIQGH